MEKPRTARLLHQLLVLYQRVALYVGMSKQKRQQKRMG